MVNLFPHAAITGFTAVLATVLVAVFLAVVFTLVSVLLGPKRPTTPKAMPYESGMNPIGGTRDRFSIHYYLVAMIYIIFDVETIFLYPWAGILRSELGVFGWVEMMVFMLILLVGYVYVIGKGALEWD